MTKIKIKDFGRAFAILAGLIFLGCTVTKIITLMVPTIAYAHDFAIYGDPVQFIEINEFCYVVEIVALFGFMAMCFTLYRTKALLFPILSAVVVNVINIVDIALSPIEMADGNMLNLFDVLSNVFIVIGAIFTIVCCLLFVIQICINTGFEKGIVSQVFLAIMAFFAVVMATLAYLMQLSGDVLGFFSNGKFEMLGNGLSGLSECVLIPVLNNIVKLNFTSALFFFAWWLIFRPKKIEITVETKEDKKARKKAEKVAKKAEKAAKKAENLAKKSEDLNKSFEPASET